MLETKRNAAIPSKTAYLNARGRFFSRLHFKLTPSSILLLLNEAYCYALVLPVLMIVRSSVYKSLIIVEHRSSAASTFVQDALEINCPGTLFTFVELETIFYMKKNTTLA